VATLVVVVIATIIILNLNFLPAKPNQIPNVTQKNTGSSIKVIDSPYVQEYELPDRTFPNGIIVDTAGMVWVAGSESTLFRFDPISGQMASYRIGEDNHVNNLSNKSLMVWSVIQDSDGLIWFSQLGPNPLWQFNPETKKFIAFHPSAAPFQMKIDKTGDIWFTTLTANTVGVIQKTNLPEHYKITEFDVGVDTYPSGLFLKENHLWITQIQSQKLAKFDIIKNKEGIITSINKTLSIPSNNETSIFSPTDIIDSGNLWITEHGTSFLTNYDVDDQLQRFPTTPSPQNSTTLPFWLRQEPNTQRIWFNEHTGNRIAFFDTASMTMTEYEIPSRPSDGYVVYPLNIAIGPNGKAWFSEWNADKIGMIDTAIPIPFDIRSDSNRIILSNEDNTSEISFEISRNESLRNNVTLSFKLSSSIDPTSNLVNMTGKFSRENINLLSMNQTEKIILDLQSHDAKSGNYTLGISATDGMVTKSVFVDLIIK